MGMKVKDLTKFATYIPAFISSFIQIFKNMRTILITGTAKPTGNKVEYNVFIWAAQTGEQIKFITSLDNHIEYSYNDLWFTAKDRAENYFQDYRFTDGAYTQFLDHLTIIG